MGAFFIEVDRIEPDPNQPRKRIDPTYLEERTRSFRRLGVLQPITVRYDEIAQCYRIIAGECRFTAARQTALPKMPCWVQTPANRTGSHTRFRFAWGLLTDARCRNK